MAKSDDMNENHEVPYTASKGNIQKSPSDDPQVYIFISDIDRYNCYSRLGAAKIIMSMTGMDLREAFEITRRGRATVTQHQADQISRSLSGIAAVRVVKKIKTPLKLKITKSIR